MYKVSSSGRENWDIMEEIISEYNLDGNDVLKYLTDWHGLDLLDEDFMENLFDELGIEIEEEEEEEDEDDYWDDEDDEEEEDEEDE